MIVALALASALAHHDSAVSQVGPREGAGSLFDDAVDRPHLELDAAYDVLSFSRTLRGSERFATDASVTVHGFALTAGVRLPSGTSFSVRVPTGILLTRTGGSTAKPRSGLGDVSVSAQQRLGGFSARLGLTAPTGAYEGTADVSVTDVTGDDGEILLTTYDTRASLGTGAWTTSGALGGQWSPGRFGVNGMVGAQVPFTDTEDEVRWGPTLSGVLGGQAEAVEDRLSVGLALDLRHHRPDRMEGIDEDTGDLVQLSPGTRTALGIGASAMARLGPLTRCGVRTHIPLWQHVDGVQLVETASGSLSCRHAWALGKAKIEASAE